MATVSNKDIARVLRERAPLWTTAKDIAAALNGKAHDVERLLAKASDSEKSKKAHHLAPVLWRQRSPQVREYALR